jgi:DNA-binding NtrC family response regulator
LVYQDDSQTLPSVEAPRKGAYGERELQLTIVFHPDISRIGQTSPVSITRKRMDYILGRSCPDFERPAGGAAPESQSIADRVTGPLDDRYISRRSLEFIYNGSKATVRRIEGSCRCRLGMSELVDEAELSLAQLEAGVSLMLANRIVLLLKLGASPHLQTGATNPTDSLIGSGYQMAQLRQQIKAAAECDLDVLVRGETGSGKELVARAIHQFSARTTNPLVSVNMAAVPADLAAAALFGAARGAYTGADEATSGYFRQAEGGTLFLDEIGDAHSGVQPQLLRALQEREVQVIGGRVEKIDVRVVSATDAPIDDDASGFSSALRHRLAALEILVPPLREHAEDIGELLVHFLQEAAGESGSGHNIPHPDMDAMRLAEWANVFCLFANYSWPGNIRELRNLCRQLMVHAQSGAILDERLLALLGPGETPGPGTAAKVARVKIQDIPEQAFEAAMLGCRYEPKAVAQYLGVSRTSVYRRIESSSRYQLATELAAGLIEKTLQEEGGSVEKAAMRLEVSAVALRSRLRKMRTVSS